jgi:hypothetical protein
MSSIKHLLAMEIKDILQESCIDAIPVGDPTRVDLVTIRSAGSKISGKRLVLTIKHMDPIDPAGWSDSTVGNRRDGGTMGSDWPIAEFIGGGTATFEKIKGIVEMSGNLTLSKENTEQADEYIQEVFSRMKYTLRNSQSRLLVLKDSYGERVKQFSVVGVQEYDSGGDNQNLSRFFLRWLAVTEPAAS